MKRCLGAVLVVLALAACSREERVGRTTTTSSRAPTALDQGNGRDDVALAGRVRRELVADPSLSIGAKNAVLVVSDGVVTLSGRVADEIERDMLVQKVTVLPGVVRVEDRLEVASSQPKE